MKFGDKENDFYADNLTYALNAMREWAKDKPQLTDQVWILSKDCPLWSMGLSLAEIDRVLCMIFKERILKE